MIHTAKYPKTMACALLVVTALGLSGLAHGQTESYPSKTVRLVNNFPPGGPLDTLARSVQPVLQELLKQPVIVENKSGAAGNIGAAEVARAPADGHTVLFGIDSTFTINPHIYKTMPFKTTDLKPVIIMASSGLLVGVHPSTGIKTLKELLVVGQNKTLNFSSAGNGSPGHLAVEMFKDEAKLKINHIPYRGNTPAVSALMAGEVDGGSLGAPGMMPHVLSGKITALAVTSTQRSRLLPDLPTVSELGLKSFEQEVLYLVMVPAATSDSVVALLQKGILEALNRPDVQRRLNSSDLNFEGLTGVAANKRLSEASARYAKIIQTTGMTSD